MAVKDKSNHFEGIGSAGSSVQTPNDVSRDTHFGDRALQNVVWEAGKPILDSELQINQDATWWQNNLLRKWQVPSGWLRGQNHYDSYDDYTLVDAPAGLDDDTDSVGSSLGGSVGGSVGDDDSGILNGKLINAIVLPRLEAVVAGHPVIVEYTATDTKGYNIVSLLPPTAYAGSATVKRTDFVFLEVWKALVAPSPIATGTIQVADASSLVAGDTITVGGVALTAHATGVPVDTYKIEAASESLTAANIADAINASANSFSTMITATVLLDTVTLWSVERGAGSVGPPPTGNFISLAVNNTVVGATAVSGPFLTGGVDRPNKPVAHQDRIFRHGNTLCPPSVCLDDEMIDPQIRVETSQRIQLQYRIRVTGASEGVNYKKHPDGFSSKSSGAPFDPMIFAQGSRSTPASSVSGRYYPFVPADQSSTWGNSSAVEYDIPDNGLWVAGDGSEQSAEDLGTMDGFVYAIPICFAFRHNDASSVAGSPKGFDPVNNANGAPLYTHTTYTGFVGGSIPPHKSDRPDGEFADIVTQNNILDLRRHVIYPGIDLASELQYQIQSVLDGSLRTWQMDIADKQLMGDDTGDVSTRYLVCNEIGRDAANGGAPPSSGNTDRGVTIRNFDHVARRFGDQPVVERVVVAYWPTDLTGTVDGKWVVKAGATPTRWYDGDVLHFDMELFDATTLSAIWHGGTLVGAPAVSKMLSDLAPPGTRITDVLSVYHDDGHYVAAVNQETQIKTIAGLGTRHVEVTLDQNDTNATGGLPITGPNPEYQMVGRAAGPLDGSPRRIFLELEITYPLGAGTTDTPDWPQSPDTTIYDGSVNAGPGPVVEDDITQRPNDLESLIAPKFRAGFREIQIDHYTNDTLAYAAGGAHPGIPVGQLVEETIVSRNQYDLYYPRRVFGDATHTTTVEDKGDALNLVTVDAPNTEFGSSSRKVTLEVGTPLSGAQTQCAIEYFPQDPVPNYGALGWQLSVYYRSNVPQTAGTKEGDVTTSGDGVLPTTLNVEPLYFSPEMWTGQVGMGSTDIAYPYAAPLDQIPVNDNLGNITEEWYFAATASTTVDDFDAETGLLNLHPFVQGDVQNVLTFGGTSMGEPPVKDAEFRAYYPVADDASYRPTIMGQPLFGSTRHKVFAPFLARATEDVPGVDGGGLLYRKDELLLIVLCRFAELDEENTVRFVDTDNTTCAALYRTRNLLLMVGGQ